MIFLKVTAWAVIIMMTVILADCWIIRIFAVPVLLAVNYFISMKVKELSYNY